ncbi:BgTH12-02328 [Blumeria graminis f. sp. triticale]|uniref:BgTH12-02328 n=1 Tax=Blumeria graminis f. sp. triticale TaxID=1689686 RepID=A0A9W4GES5_BLUGR|nr:BgTH12-02328 [Blumeria graminis f. sp. triticale]
MTCNTVSLILKGHPNQL